MALEGHLHDMPLIDLLQVFNSGHKHGKLVLMQEQARGIIWFLGGRVINAVFLEAKRSSATPIIGEEAIFQLLRWDDGAFAFVPPCPNETQRILINRSTEWLIIEGLRRRDEHQYQATYGDLTPQTRVRLVPTLHQDESIHLDLEEWRVISQITSETTIESIIESTGYAAKRVMQLLTRLIALDLVKVITIEETVQQRRLAAPDPEQMLHQEAPTNIRVVVQAIKDRLLRTRRKGGSSYAA